MGGVGAVLEEVGGGVTVVVGAVDVDEELLLELLPDAELLPGVEPEVWEEEAWGVSRHPANVAASMMIESTKALSLFACVRIKKLLSKGWV